jgi:transcription antitermination protein NusB
MSSMRKSRELAMQVLFLWDANGIADADVAAQAMRDVPVDQTDRVRAMEMADAAWARRETSDALVEGLAPQWPPRRQPGVDRAILRLAVWELTAADTPPKVSIDEAIELAKAFSTEQSPAFVNGVLDAVLRQKQPASAQPTSSLPNSEHPQPAEG